VADAAGREVIGDEKKEQEDDDDFAAAAAVANDFVHAAQHRRLCLDCRFQR